MRIGICGTGTMGTAIATRLMDRGHDVVVWNRTAERAAPLIAYWESLAEALSFAAAEGVNRDVAGSLMADSSGAIKVAPPRIPNIVKAIGGDMPETGFFTLGAMAKDLRLMHAVAEQAGFTVPVADAALSVYDAAENEGWGARDGTMIAAWKIPKQK